MNFKDYQRKARATAIYPDKDNNIYYPCLGLAGEAGEVCEKIKKVMRDNEGVVSYDTMLEIKKELGDVLWYISNLCNELDITLEGVAIMNIEKLLSRKERGVIQGEGDNR